MNSYQKALRISCLFGLFVLLAGCNSLGRKQNIEVTFDGNECTVTGPTKLPVGEHSIVFIDSSETWGSEMHVNIYLPGYTWQDTSDYIGDPWSYPPVPHWVDLIPHSGKEFRSLKDIVFQYSFETVGEYEIIVEAISERGNGVWACAPFMVVEFPSE